MQKSKAKPVLKQKYLCCVKESLRLKLPRHKVTILGIVVQN